MLFTEDAMAYAKGIKCGQYKARDLVEYALENIDQYNPRLNAVVHCQADQALDLAGQYDQILSKGGGSSLPPFLGVPILLKDLGQEEAGQPAGSGSRLLTDYRAARDSHFTEAIKAAGFIIVGRTNVPEFGFKNQTDSRLHGRVPLVQDASKSAGGSSGGAGVALKAGLVPIVTASDGGGSIRIPASFNGLIGLKPTRGRTPVGPGAYRGWQGAAIDFALTRSVRDTWAMLQVLDSRQAANPFMAAPLPGHLVPLDRPLKIGRLRTTPLGSPIWPEAQKGLDVTRQILEDAGHQVLDVDLSLDGEQAMRSYYLVNAVETKVMMESLEESLGRPVTADDMEASSWALYQAGFGVSASSYSKLLTYWDQMAAQMEDFFTDYDLILSPTTNGPAFALDAFDWPDSLVCQLRQAESLAHSDRLDLIWEMFAESLAWTPFTQQQNLTGQPAMSLPLYETAEGLPLGMQFWAGRGQEALLLQLAQELEAKGYLKAGVHPMAK